MRAALLTAAAVLVLVWAPPTGGEIYRWTDAAGNLHFTEDPSDIPPAYREEAIRRNVEGEDDGGSLQTYTTYDDPPAARAQRPRPGGAPAGAGPGRAIRIPVQRAGTTMMVNVRLNNAVVAPFVVDTGASDVAIPRWAAEQLGLEAGKRTRRYQTANGIIEEPVVMLDLVELGGAKVREVPASISSTMDVGLLGLTFFNHFTYHVDAAAGVLTLVPNQLEETGLIRGGRSQAQWRAEYADLEYRQAAIEAEMARTPNTRARKRRQLEEALADVMRQRQELEAEADEARVPMAWRD